MKRTTVCIGAISIFFLNFFAGCVSWEERVSRADNGDSCSQYYVAQAYRDREKTEQNMQKGRDYYSQALKNDNVDAKKDFCDYVFLEVENSNIAANRKNIDTILQAEKFLYELLNDDVGSNKWQKTIVEALEAKSEALLTHLLEKKEFKKAKEFVKTETDVYSIAVKRKLFLKEKGAYKHCWGYYPYKFFCDNFPVTLHPVIGIPLFVADTLCTVVWTPAELVCYCCWLIYEEGISSERFDSLCCDQNVKIERAIEEDIRITQEKEKIKKEIYRYFSLKSELVLLQDLKKIIEEKISNWDSSIEHYKNKPPEILIIRGFITQKTDDGWYIFLGGNKWNRTRGAFQMNSRQYTTTGRFSLEVVGIGTQEFSQQNGHNVSIPCYREVTYEEKMYDLLNRNMVSIGVKNKEQCKKILESIDSKIQGIYELIEKYDKVIAENHIELKVNAFSIQELKTAIEQEDIHALEEMVSKNLDINQVYSEDKEQYTILMYAVKNNKQKVVDFLLKNNAFVDVLGNITSVGNEKVSALGIAEYFGHHTIADKLLNHHACVNNGMSPYELAGRRFLGRPSEEIIARWDQLTERGGMPQYLNSTSELHIARFFLQLRKSSPHFPLIEYWIKAMGRNVLICTYSYYGMPSCSEDVLKLLFPADFAR